MHLWPAWARWLVLALGYALLLGGGWAMAWGEGPLRVLGLLAFAASMPLLIHAGRAAMRERSRQVDRRYAREFMPAMVAYMLLMIYVWPLQKGMAPGWPKLGIAILPALSVLWVIVASIRYVLGSDELERRQQLEALAIGAAIVSVAAMTMGFLASAGIFQVDGALVLLLVYPALCLTYGITKCWLVWRQRGE